MQKLTLIFVFLFLISFSAQAQSTWQELDSMGTAFLQAQKFQEADSFLNEALVLVEQEVGKNDTLYAGVLNQLLVSAYYQGKYKEATVYGKQVVIILGLTLGEDHLEYAKACNNLATLYEKQGLYAEAEPLYIRTKNSFEKILGATSSVYAASCNNLALLYSSQGLYDKAEPLYIEAKNIREKVLGKEHPNYATSCNNLAKLYETQGLYDKAEPLFVEAKEIRAKVLGKQHADYATSCNNLALLYKGQGLYDKAEPLYIEAKNIREKILGKEHPYYAQICNNLALLYKGQGLYDKAEPLYIEAKNTYEKSVGKEHPDYTSSCNNLAVLYQSQGLYDKAEPLFVEAKEIRAKVLGKEHADYATSCNNLAALYQSQGLYEKAEPLFVEAKKIRAKVLGKEHPIYATSCNNLAGLYQSQGLYSKAEALFVEAKNIFEKVLGKQHPAYAGTCNNLASLYYKKGLYKKAEQLYVEVIGNKTVQINNLLPTFSEKERIAYLSSIQKYFNNFQDFALDYHKENLQITADLYNQNLFTKSLVFASTQKMRQQILSSGDSSLIQDFESWKKQKETYNKLIQQSKEEQGKSGVNLDAMATDINELERSLSKRSTLFVENTTIPNYKWQQVKDKLGKREAVVEIIRSLKTVGYDSLGKNIIDTVYIALFVTEKTKKQPDILVLENGSELEAKYLNYYKRAIEFKIEDQNSYNQYWKPIQNKLEELRKKGFDKIYFSPDGVYHQISLNSLRNPETDEFLLESQNIQLIGTSRDLIELGTSETDLSQNFENYRTYLLGYPTYNLEGEGTESEGEDRSLSSLQRIVGQRGSAAMLPGTKTEIEVIKGYFNQKNIKTQVLLETDANEANFKNIKSPTILHIATHGFFVPKIKDSEVQTMQDAVNRNLLENPFMRSGLLLAGCETPNPEGEDGVLTAEEAMNLSLENTQLVVLSACETGLGDIQNGEGVFGLQRAFQQAGAKTVLMSLWKVSDEATQLLMTEFYKNLLSGKSKRAAFKAAQFSLKQKFPEPYFWGAFVMVGE
ncbi:MAG: CHAT domain-containing protein [Bernardetiaceae bacterium]|nr:CHAT domain-containing protein [Bernardetiaceae bacterium]